MAGPSRTSQPASDSPGAYDIQPPRPPNAWILYRSHQFALLRQNNERLSQGDVSKRVATMWKNETQSVKHHFELLAEAEKLRHQQMYPGYRFRPRRKDTKSASKEEIREIRRARKARAREAANPNAFAPASTLSVVPSVSQQLLPPANAPTMPMSQPFAFPSGAHYGPYGPSPPISAAPSPLRTSRSPQPPSDHTRATSSASPTPGSELQLSAQLTSNQFYPSVHPTSNQPTPNIYAPQPRSKQLLQSAALGGQMLFPSARSSGIAVSHEPIPSLRSHNVNFRVPFDDVERLVGAQRAISNAPPSNPILSTVNQNGVSNVTNVDNRTAGARPADRFQVAMGQRSPTADNIGQYSEDELIKYILGDGPESPKVATPPVPQEPLPNSTELDTYNASQQPPSSASTLDMMSYLNFDAADDATNDTPVAPTLPVPTTVAPQQTYLEDTQQASQMPIFTQMTNVPAPSVTTSSSYVPSAGAIYASTRRSAESWKPQFEDSVHSWIFPN